jgi:hypothetical protein
MWISFAQCEYSIHTHLGGCEIAQFLVATLHDPYPSSRRQLVPFFGQSYAPQTKILEGRTNIRERIYKALFKDA